MTFKAFFKATQMTEMTALVLAPLSVGMIESFYKYDMMPFGRLALIAVLVWLGLLILNLLKILAFNRHDDWFKAVKSIAGLEQLNVSANTIRLLTGALVAVLAFGLYLLVDMTKIEVLIPVGIAMIFGVLYVTGPKPLWQTPLSEIVFCFGLGYVVPVFVTYSCAYNEIMMPVTFWIEMLWVCLPLVFALALIQFACNSVLIEYNPNWMTMVNIMGKKRTEQTLEVAIFLVCLLPTIAIYLKNAPWTIIGLWIMYPKLRLNVQLYQTTPYREERIHAMIQNAEIIIVFQVLLYAMGMFF